MRSSRLFMIFSSMILISGAAQAEDYVLTLQNHLFSPTEITIPADQKVKLVVKNLDATPAEFESHDLNREKVIAGKSEATILVGPLKAGAYSFVDEFHEDTAKGTLIVK